MFIKLINETYYRYLVLIGMQHPNNTVSTYVLMFIKILVISNALWFILTADTLH